MNKEISKLAKTIRCYDETTLASFKKTLDWLERFKKALAGYGVKIDPVGMLEYDPTLIYETEKERVNRANKALEDIRIGKKANPQRSISYWLDVLARKSEEIVNTQDEVEELRQEVEDNYGDLAICAAEDAENYCDDEDDDTL